MKNYSIGALLVLIISIGCAAIVYGGGFIVFQLPNLAAWIFGPLGLYTLVFAVIGGEFYYHLGLGVLLLGITSASIFFNLVNIFVIIGILLIVLALIATLSYLRIRSKPKQK